MVGLTYHPSITCPPHESCWSGLLYDMILVLGVDNSVLLKSNSPNRYACADNYGFTHKSCNKLSVKISLTRSQYHSDRGGSVSQDTRPAL